MDSIRLVLIISFAMVSMKLWTSWETTYGNSAVAISSQTSVNGVDEPADIKNNELPQSPAAAGVSGVPALTQSTAQNLPGQKPVEIRTDIFVMRIDPQGAGISHTALLDYPTSLEKPEDPFVLMDTSEHLTYVLQGGLLSKQAAPTHESQFNTSQQQYEMVAGMNELQVPFTWEQDGISVTKTYEFLQGSHQVRVRYNINNNSSTTWSGRAYSQFKRNAPEQGGMRLIYTYTGPVISGPENRYEKIPFKDITSQALTRDVADGWMAMIQHYFLTALVPTDKTSTYHYYARDLGNNMFAAGALTPVIEIKPGEQKEIEELVYLGPKDQDQLEQIATGLDLTVDYGKLWFLAKPLFWGLSKVHEYTGNWGWSIILITIFLKLFFYKLSAAGYRSMANMRRVQPRLVALRDRYKEDRAKLNQAMMQIYKEEKINPLGGCFPILIQIPVFIALYWVLLESIELRQAPFVLWIQDLSTPDPYWVLPLVMGITMFVQQKLNPAPIDPIQAKVMMIMPFAFTIFFGFFPSGLVLYWVANNTLSIAQQWMITRNLERAGLGSKSR
jgi:YidC/Oxa1 family membrane protein insertase